MNKKLPNIIGKPGRSNGGNGDQQPISVKNRVKNDIRIKGKFGPGNACNPNGRPIGSQNKITHDIRKYVFGVAEKLERNNRGLYHFAKQEPRDFWQIFSKFIPKNVNVTGQVDVIHRLHRVFGQVEASQFIPDLSHLGEDEPQLIDLDAHDTQIFDAIYDGDDEQLVSDSS